MPRVRKQVLAPGWYWTEKGPVEFTSADVQHFCAQGKAMLAAGLDCPVPLEHQDDAKPLDRAARLARSVSHNTGFVADYAIEPDGSLWADVDVNWLPEAKNDAEILHRLNTTIKFVSPEILPEFVAGDGTRFERVISHLALTPAPVWAGQAPFGGDGATLMSHGSGRAWSDAPEPLRLSLAGRLDPAMSMALTFKARLDRLRFVPTPKKQRLSKGANPMAKEPEEKDEGLDDELTAPDLETPGDEQHLDDCKAILAQLGIHMPESTTAENFLEHLCVAGHALVKADQGKPKEDPAALPDKTVPHEEPQTVSMSTTKKPAANGKPAPKKPDPDPLRLSQENRIQRLETQLAEERLQGMNQVIDTLVREGQATPALADSWKTKLGTKRLSLVAGDDADVREVLAQVEMAKTIPAGTFWSAEEKASKAKQEPVPSHAQWDGQEITPARVKKIVAEQFGDAAE